MNENEILEAVESYIENKLGQKTFLPGKSYVNASGPKLDAMDVVALVKAALGMWYTEGKYADLFKRELKARMDKDFCLLTNSGSSASLLAIECMRTLDHFGGFVITTALGFPTTISGLYKDFDTPLIPYYIDIDKDTLQPNYDQLGDVYKEPYIKGVILTHTLGFPFNEIKVRTLVGEETLILADCCDALGAELQYPDYPCPVGDEADFATLSFFPAHHITSAEGGAVLTNNLDYAEIMRSFASWGRSCFCLPGQTAVCGNRFGQKHGNMPDGYDHKYIFSRLGYNLKMTELQAALGYSQSLSLDGFTEKRRENYKYLQDNLFIFLEYLQFVVVPTWSKPSPFGFPIMVREDAPFSANDLIFYLEEHKVRTRRFFGGNLTRQPAFMNMPYEAAPDLSGTDYLTEYAFWIGCHPALTKEMLDYVIEQFDGFFKERGL